MSFGLRLLNKRVQQVECINWEKEGSWGMKKKKKIKFEVSCVTTFMDQFACFKAEWHMDGWISLC